MFVIPILVYVGIPLLTGVHCSPVFIPRGVSVRCGEMIAFQKPHWTPQSIIASRSWNLSVSLRWIGAKRSTS